jgi:hypothetical protein
MKTITIANGNTKSEFIHSHEYLPISGFLFGDMVDATYFTLEGSLTGIDGDSFNISKGAGSTWTIYPSGQDLVPVDIRFTQNIPYIRIVLPDPVSADVTVKVRTLSLV